MPVGNTCVSTASGNWNDSTKWTGCGGAFPDSGDDVFIEAGHTITLTATQACKDLNLNTTTSQTRLDLGANTLSLNGKLRAYTGAAPGTSTGTLSATAAWIMSTTGKISIVGNSRALTSGSEWGAGNAGTASPNGFDLEINLTAGQTATLATAVKARSLNVISGTFDAGVNTVSVDTGAAGGDITISNGATLTSARSAAGTPVFQRTSSTLGGTLTVNGTLQLSGTSPAIAMTAVVLNGTVDYSRSGTQNLGTVPSGASQGGAATLSTYNNLKFSGTSAKTLLLNITVNGTFTMAGDGTVALTLGAFSLTYGGSSTLEYAGSGAQTTANNEFPAASGPNSLTINNSSGVALNGAKTINGTLTLTIGALNNSTNNVTLGNGTTISRATGTLNSAPTFGTTVNVTYTGSTGVTTGNEIPTSSTVLSALTVNNTGGVTLGAAVTVNGTLTIGSGATLDVSASDFALNMAGASWSNSGTFTPRSGTVTFNGTAAQAISGSSTTSFNNLTDSNTSGALSSSINFNVAGTLSMNGAATLMTPGASVQINSAGNTGTISGTGTVQVTRLGANPFSNQYRFSTNTLSAMTVDYASAGDQGVENGVASYGALKTSGSGTKTMGGGVTLPINGGVTIGSGTILAIGANNLNVAGNWVNNAGLSGFTMNSDKTITFNGTNQTLSGNTTFANLTINTSGSPNTVSAAGSTLAVTGLLRVQSGTFTSATQFGDVQIDAAGTLTLSGDISVSGNWTNNGTFNNGGFTVTFNGTAAQAISGSATTSFSGLTDSNTNAALSSSVNFNVTGTMTVNANAQFNPDAAVVINSGGAQGSITGSGKIFVTKTTATASLTGQYKFSSYSMSNMTVEYSGTGNQTVDGLSYKTLIISGSGVKAPDSGVSILGGDLTISAATLDLGAFSANRQTSGGTLTVASGATLKIGGTGTLPSNYSTHSIGATSTIEYSGTDQSVATLNSLQNYGNLTISGSGTKSLAGDVTVTTALTLNGGLSIGANTLTINGAVSYGAGGLGGGATSNIVVGGSGASTVITNVVLNNFTINRANGISLSCGCAAEGTVTVNGTLTLTNGAVNNSPTNVALGNSATISRASGGSLSSAPTFGTSVNVSYTGFYRIQHRARAADFFIGTQQPDNQHDWRCDYGDLQQLIIDRERLAPRAVGQIQQRDAVHRCSDRQWRRVGDLWSDISQRQLD